MKQKNRERVIGAWEESLEKCGFPGNFDRGMKFICRELEKNIRQFKQIGSRRALDNMLMQEPEMEPHAFDAQITAIRLIPYQIRKALPQATKELSRKLPHAPGGRPRLLTPDERRDACSQILTLYGQGVKLRDAQKRIAVQREVGLRTVQRAWQHRAGDSSRQ